MHPLNQNISLLNASDLWFNVSRIGKNAMLDLHEASQLVVKYRSTAAERLRLTCLI